MRIIFRAMKDLLQPAAKTIIVPVLKEMRALAVRMNGDPLRSERKGGK